VKIKVEGGVEEGSVDGHDDCGDRDYLKQWMRDRSEHLFEFAPVASYKQQDG
jgi:hypothetical protein